MSKDGECLKRIEKEKEEEEEDKGEDGGALCLVAAAFLKD